MSALVMSLSVVVQRVMLHPLVGGVGTMTAGHYRIAMKGSNHNTVD